MHQSPVNQGSSSELKLSWEQRHPSVPAQAMGRPPAESLPSSSSSLALRGPLPHGAEPQAPSHPCLLL